MRRQNSGNAIVEILMGVALIAAVTPMVFRGERDRMTTRENAAASADLRNVQNALANYIDANKIDLARKITRGATVVKISDLDKFASREIKNPDAYQARIIKGARGGFLYGLVASNTDGELPLRTRAIGEMTGESAGFSRGAELYGAFGTWRADARAFGANIADNSLLMQTRAVAADSGYLMRAPSAFRGDATMAADIDMNGFALENAGAVTGKTGAATENLIAKNIDAARASVAERAEITGEFIVKNDAVVAGGISSDGQALRAEGLEIRDVARFRNMDARTMRVYDLNLPSLMVGADFRGHATLSVIKKLELPGGKIDAEFAVVGFGGALSPAVTVREKISDGEYFWDVRGGAAVLNDMQLSELNTMMQKIIGRESRSTETYNIMSRVSANGNATAADYTSGINAARDAVRVRFNQLNLE